jgi:hypothetical protein
MALSTGQVQKKSMILKAKEINDRLAKAASFGQPLGVGDTVSQHAEEGRDTKAPHGPASGAVGYADGGQITDRVASTRNVTFGHPFDDQSALGIFGQSATRGGLLSRPESAMTRISPEELLGMQTRAKDVTPQMGAYDMTGRRLDTPAPLASVAVPTPAPAGNPTYGNEGRGNASGMTPEVQGGYAPAGNVGPSHR